MRLTTFNELIAKIERDPAKIAFFIGAGVSASAGIPTAMMIIDQLKETVYRREFPEIDHPQKEAIDRWCDSQNDFKRDPYAFVLERSFVSRRQRQRFIQGLCEVKNPA